MSAAEYERIHGEKRVSRRVETRAGVAFAIKQLSGEYKIYRVDQLIGTIAKHGGYFVARLPDGSHLTTDSVMKWCVERLQIATPVYQGGLSDDVNTRQYAEQLLKKHGYEAAYRMTDGPARKMLGQLPDHENAMPDAISKQRYKWQQ